MIEQGLLKIDTTPTPRKVCQCLVLVVAQLVVNTSVL